MSNSKTATNNTGFTLIECVVTLVLLGLLSSVAISVTDAFRAKAEQTMLSSENVLKASSCMERIKSLAAENDSVTFKPDCSGYASAEPSIVQIVAEPLVLKSVTTTNNDGKQKPKEYDTNDNKRLIRVSATGSSCTACVTLRLVTVKSGNVELYHVLK